MRLIFDDPSRPQDLFVIAGRTDGDPTVRQGEEFEVDDARGRELLSLYEPRLKVAQEAPSVGSSENLTPVVVFGPVDEQAERAAQ